MNLERIRAKHALATVELWRNKDVKKYVSYVKGLPAAILQNGLGQAMATLLAAADGKPACDDAGQIKEAHRLLYNHIENWLCQTEDSPSPYQDQTNLMKAITENDEEAYMLAQAEALAYLEWLKKFAVAYLTKPGEGNEGAI